MSKKLKRSAVALVLAATMVFSSQGVLTAFAVGENETSTAVDVSALEPILDKEETVVVEEPGNTDETETPEVEVCEECQGVNGNHAETCPHYVDPNTPPENPTDDENNNNQEQQECTCGAEEGQPHEEGCPLYEEATIPECTCGAEEGQPHEEGCPLYEEPTVPECTCGAEEGQPHQEGCPLYEENTEETQEPSEEDVAAAKNVSDLIGALPEASTLDPETTDVEALAAQVKAAREAYDKLTDAQKALVERTVLDKLVALEGALEGLEQVETIPELNEDTVAVIDDQQFNTISAAVKAAETGDTITLTKDVTESLVTLLPTTQHWDNLTIDLGGFNWKNSSNTQCLIASLAPGKSVTVKNGSFNGCTSNPIMLSSGTLTIENITFENCNSQNIITATKEGTTLQLNNSVTFKNNTTSGAVVSVAEGTTLTMNGVKFESNNGTTIVSADGEADLTNCTFSGNTATSDAIVRIDMVAESPSSVTGCNFSNNNAVNGALHVTGTSSGSTTTTISGCTFAGNTGKNGGAVYVGAVVNIQNCTFQENTAGYFGGAIMVSGSAADTNYEANITNCTITNNKATKSLTEPTGSGGGIFVQANGHVTIDDLTVIHSNTAEYAGDDICVRGDSASVTISPVGENWVLADCEHEITGWYQDSKDNRWSEDNITEEVTFEGDTLTLTASALKAAHNEVDTPIGPDPDPGEEQTWDHSKSKTATNLDENYESKVTLSLPSAEEQLESDVVFVLDKSSCATEVTDSALEMLADLNASIKNSGAIVNVGVVQFAGRATTACPLTPLTEEAIAEDGEIYMAFSEQRIKDGTNIQAGLLEAQKILAADTDVSNNRKYVVLVTDGLSYLFLEGDEVKSVYNAIDADGQRVWCSLSAWSVANGFGDGSYEIPGGDWDTYFATIKNNVAKDGDQYVHNFDEYGSMCDNGIPPTYVPMGSDSMDHALSLDRAIYEANKVYESMEASGYHCYAVYKAEPGSKPVGDAFVQELNNGQILDFDDIQDDIFYLLDAGSSVVDVIGYGKDDSESKNDYNFDFVNDIKTLSLTVGGKPLSVRELAPDGNGTSAYGFYDPNNASGDNDFVLRYYKNGQDGNSDECFVWEINVPVSNFAPVQLTYTVKLTNPQTVEGVYGKYDEDGSEGYTSLYTNKEATLYPVDSNGDNGVPENFPKPTVSYTVDNGNDNPGTDPTPDPDPDPDRPSRPNRDDDDDWEPLPDAPVKDKPTTEVDVPEETETPTTEQPDKYNPETGDTTTVFAAMALAAVSLGGVVLLGRKKK